MNKALKIVLAASLALSLVPTVAFADGEDILEPQFDRGTGLLANSWRFTDGYPDSWLNDVVQEEPGISLYGAWSDLQLGDLDLPDAWTKSNGTNSYTIRSTPTSKDRIVNVPDSIAVGIDVSVHNNMPSGTPHGPIDWNAVKADGISFVLIRCGYGSDFRDQDDKWFVENYKGAKAAGLDIGIYLYSYAMNVTGNDSSAESEAKHVLRLLGENNIKPADLTLPIYLDMEDEQSEEDKEKGKKRQGNLSPSQLADIATKFCDTVVAAGYKVGIYSSQSWFKDKLTAPVFSPSSMAANGWSRWVARYSGGSSSSGVEGTDIWQFTAVGKVSGTPKRYCDVNFAYVTPGKFPVSRLVKPVDICSVTYNLNGGKNHASNSATYTGTLALKNPTRAGYKFDGWYTDAKFTNKVTKLTKKNAILYAKWSQPYKITYKLNGGKNHKSNPKKYGGTITLKNPTRSGYTFKGWYTDKKFKKKVTKLTNKKVTLYAKWAKNYKITYKLNGGKNSKSNPKKASGTVKLKNPTRTGYVFKGWYTNKKLTKKVTKLSMTKNRTVYAKWQKLKPGTYKVTAKSGLNIRKTTSTKSAIRGFLRPNQKVKIVKVSKGWGKLSGGRGWISLSYAKRV